MGINHVKFHARIIARVSPSIFGFLGSSFTVLNEKYAEEMMEVMAREDQKAKIRLQYDRPRAKLQYSSSTCLFWLTN